jgi:hypothetical protein
VAALGIAALAYGCGTDAVGVDACRTIEKARCEVAPACTGDPDTFAIRSEEQVRNCITLYNDHCLHGLENAEVDEPSQGNIDRCVNAIKATAACKKAGVPTMAECLEVVSLDTTLTPCQALHAPETLEDCVFIRTPPKEGEDAAAASSSSTGTGGAGGGV